MRPEAEVVHASESLSLTLRHVPSKKPFYVTISPLLASRIISTAA